MEGYVASFSGGKDSTAMVLKLLKEQPSSDYPLDEVVFFDTGMEFDSVYKVVGFIESLCEVKKIGFHRLYPDEPFLSKMLIRPVKDHYGYDWCGGLCRWMTRIKLDTINRYCKGRFQYVGIAYDEQQRCADKLYPLIDWKMTESDCLRYCYSQGISWKENGIELYSILDRVSCWCCSNKNLKELKAIYKHLPKYWGYLKGLQSRIDRPFRRDGKTIFDLEEIFKTKEETND